MIGRLTEMCIRDSVKALHHAGLREAVHRKVLSRQRVFEHRARARPRFAHDEPLVEQIFQMCIRDSCWAPAGGQQPAPTEISARGEAPDAPGMAGTGSECFT